MNSTANTKYLISIIATITIVYCILFRQFYFTNEYLPTHDFNVSIVSNHIVTNYLYNGHLPLWSPEQNSGSPIWPEAETYPGYDPIAQGVNFIFAIQNSNSVYSNTVTVFLWHLVFALGAFLLFSRLGLHLYACIFGFGILLFSGLTALNFRQSDDYVSVYRYVPLLLYCFVKFFEERSIKASILLGLVGGVSVAGYHTANILVVLLFVLIAGIPLFVQEKDKFGLLHTALPGLLIASLILFPFVVAGYYWITNVAVSRLVFPGGYRGGVSDLLGPLSKYYNDETAIMLGLVPTAFAGYSIVKLILSRIQGEQKYWPNYFILIVSALLWVMYIGFFENFSGMDQPFLFIRSFNNMNPYIYLALVFFACLTIDKLIKNNTGELTKSVSSKSLVKDPIIVICFLVIMITLFIEMSRPSVITWAFNRYAKPALYPMSSPRVIEYFFDHLSLAHITVGILVCLSLAGLFWGLAQKRFSVVVFSILSLTLVELTIGNTLLLTSHHSSPNSADRDLHEQKPMLSAPMVKAPPTNRPRAYKPQSHWFKQGNVLHHEYSSIAPMQATWFQTNRFFEFSQKINSEKRFDELTGVTSPLLFFAKKAIRVSGAEILNTLNSMSEEKLASTLVFSEQETSSDLPSDMKVDDSAKFEIKSFGPNHIEIWTTNSNQGYLAYLDSYDENWKSYIDGTRVNLLRANYIFKAVLVPQGTHTIRMEYSPTFYVIGFYLRIIGVLGAIVLLVVLNKSEGKNEFVRRAA